MPAILPSGARALLSFLVLASISVADEIKSPRLEENSKRGRTRLSLDSDLLSVDDIVWPVELGVQQTEQLETSFGCRGTFGTGYYGGQIENGWPQASFDTPPGSDIRYLWGAALWIGGVVDGDTLVSVGADAIGSGGEFKPPGLNGEGSITPIASPADFSMRAEFTDTISAGVPDDWTGRAHIPLNIRVANRSYVWREEPYGSFVLYDLVVTNIGSRSISGGYFGLYCDPDIHRLDDRYGYLDDLSGSIRPEGIFYGIDNDGDPVDGTYSDSVSTSRIFALKFLECSFPVSDTGFNWWSTPVAGEDFGPRHLGTNELPYRDFGTGGWGVPLGDGNKYHVMSLAEWDYDQCYTWSQYLLPLDTVWLKPDLTVTNDLTDGTDTRFLASIGPFSLDPDSSVRVLLTMFTADSVHADAQNFHESLPEWPYGYLVRLGLENLIPVAEAAADKGKTLLDPRLPSTGLKVAGAWSDSALLEWDPWVFPGVDAVEVALAEVDQSQFPHAGVIPPWMHPDAPGRSLSIQAPWQFMLRDLEPDAVYSVKLAQWSGGELGEFCAPVHLRSQVRLAPPQLPVHTFMPEGGPVSLEWTPSECGRVDHYHLYRFPDSATAENRYGAFYDRGLMRREITPVDSIQIGDTMWFYYAMDVHREIDGAATQCDISARDGEVFVLAAVDERGFESELTAVSTVTEVAGAARDVLVVTHSNEIADVFTPFHSITQFYQTVLFGLDYDIYSVSDSCPLDQYHCPELRDLGRYRLVIVDDGIFDNLPNAVHETAAREYRSYLESGGKLAYFGSFSSYLHHASNTTPVCQPLADEFANEFFGIDSVLYVGYGYFILNRLPIVDDLFGFNRAEPISDEYPLLTCDTARFPMGPSWAHFWPSNTPPTVAVFSANDRGVVTHTYQSLLTSPSMFEGRPVGVKTSVGSQETFLFGFHLYYMHPVEATELVAYMLNLTPTSVGSSGEIALPEGYCLNQNYPNPFNPETWIDYDLPSVSEVRLRVYNVLGQEVATLFEGRQSAGSHSVVWRGKDAAGRSLASGVYFYRLQAGEFSQTRKMVLLK